MSDFKCYKNVACTIEKKKSYRSTTPPFPPIRLMVCETFSERQDKPSTPPRWGGRVICYHARDGLGAVSL